MDASTVVNRFCKLAPLAVMSRIILDEIISDELDVVFQTHRQRGYERDLLFSQLTRTIAQVVLGLCETPNQAYNKLAQELAVSKAAFYGKLQRIEPEVCRASVQHAYRRCREMLAALGSPPREILQGYRVRMIDGNHLEGCENRLRELRNTWATALPGTAVVIHDPQWNLVEDVFLIPDGHAQERTIFPALLETVQPCDLIVADSHYCTISFLKGIAERQACHVIRQHGALKGTLLGKRKSCGRSATGKVFEQSLLIEATSQATARRITIELDQPTHSGDREIHILSNLPAEAASAPEIAQLYLLRHEIEHVFYLSTTTLTCEVKGLNYPSSALFVFCTAILAINARFVLFRALENAHGEEISQTLSHHSVAQEIRESCEGFFIAVPDEEWRSDLPKTLGARIRRLVKIAEHLNIARHTKSVRGPKKPPPPREKYRNGQHLSVEKILKQRK